MSAGRAYLLGLALGLVVLAFIGALQLPPLASHGDFAEQWAASRVVLEGGDPYNTATWRADAARLAGRASDAVAFVYPPYVPLLLVPLALLPLPVAATLFVLVSTVLAAFALHALLRARAAAPLVAFGFGFALLASGAALLAFAQGQWSYLLLAATCAAAVGGRRAITAVLLVVKPAIAPLPLIGLIVTSGPPARRRLLIALGVTVAATLLTLVKLDWWTEWLRGELNFASARPIRTASLFTMLEPLGVFGLAAALALVAVALFLCWRSRTRDGLAVWLASGVLVAPYIQAYDHLLLLAPLAIVSTGTKRGALVAEIGLTTLVIGELAFAWLTLALGRDALSVLVALAVWVLVLLARSDRSAPHTPRTAQPRSTAG